MSEGSLIPLRALIAFTVVPNRSAIEPSVSPGLTRYVRRALGLGFGVAEGDGARRRADRRALARRRGRRRRGRGRDRRRGRRAGDFRGRPHRRSVRAGRPSEDERGGGGDHHEREATLADRPPVDADRDRQRGPPAFDHDRGGPRDRPDRQDRSERPARLGGRPVPLARGRVGEAEPALRLEPEEGRRRLRPADVLARRRSRSAIRPVVARRYGQTTAGLPGWAVGSRSVLEVIGSRIANDGARDRQAAAPGAWRHRSGPETQKSWRRPMFPKGCPLSIFGAGELNFRVRDGNGCGLSARVTRISCVWTLFGRPSADHRMVMRERRSILRSRESRLIRPSGRGALGPATDP